MKITFIMLTLLAMTSCSNYDSTATRLEPKSTHAMYGSEGQGKPLEEITHEGCQYIGRFSGNHGDWGTHKGNCNNPIHDKTK